MVRSSWMSWKRFAGVVICLVVIAGCGGAGARPSASISGQVRLDGAPLSAGSIHFTSPKTGETAYANLDGNGRYRVTFPEADLGAEYEVAVRAPVDEDIDATALLENPQPRTETVIPQKYTDRTTSGLRAEIARAGENEFDFELQSD